MVDKFSWAAEDWQAILRPVTAVERLLEKVGLARVYVPAHTRIGEDGNLIHVDAYWREDPSPAARTEKVVHTALSKLRGTGGFSLRRSGYEPETGYMVAVPNAEETYDPLAISDVDVASYMARHRDLLSKPGNFFGGWYDRKTNKVYLDISKNERDLEAAKRRGREWGQLAIFDLNTFSEIRLAQEEGLVGIFLPKDDPAKAWGILKTILPAAES